MMPWIINHHELFNIIGFVWLIGIFFWSYIFWEYRHFALFCIILIWPFYFAFIAALAFTEAWRRMRNRT